MNKFSLIVQRQLKHDAPYAWFLRHQASTSPLFRRKHLAELDQRLESYLSCFQQSQYDEFSLLSTLNFDDWGAVFIMALVALRTNDSNAFDCAIDALKEAQQATELSDALCRVSYKIAKPFISKLLVQHNPLARIAAITAMGFFTTNIEKQVLHPFLNDTPSVIVATLKMIAKNKLFAGQNKVCDYLTHDNQAVRFHAAYAACFLALPAALSVLQSFCFEQTVYLRRAIELLYQVINESDINHVLTRIHESNYSPRIKAYNIVMAGLPDRLPILIEWMKDPEYAPIAGEAFSFMTGVDIEENDLSLRNVELCENQHISLAEKRKKDRWTQAYEDDLAWPDADLVYNWWQANKAHFTHGSRYLAGKTLTEQNLHHVLCEGTQTQRHFASLVLALKNPQAMQTDVLCYDKNTIT